MEPSKAWAKQPWFWLVVGGIVAIFAIVSQMSTHSPPSGTAGVIQQGEAAPPATQATASTPHAHSTQPAHHASKATTAARRWVAHHGGAMGAQGDGWVANSSTWTVTWPWGHYDYAEVVCSSAYGGVSYVMLGNEGYMFDSANGVPEGNPLNVSGNAMVEAENGSTAQRLTGALRYASRSNVPFTCVRVHDFCVNDEPNGGERHVVIRAAGS